MSAPWMSDAQIVASYKNATDRAAQVSILADINGCARSVIAGVLIENGCIEKPKPKDVHALDFSVAQAMYDAGALDREIAETTRRKLSAIQRWRQKNNLPANTRHRRVWSRQVCK